MRKSIKILSLLFVLLFFASCSMGKERTYCEENGADYSNAGVCEDMMDILEHPNETIQRAYSNTGRCGGGR